MSSDVFGRRSATSRFSHARAMESGAPATDVVSADAPAEVLDFIRHCYRRRGIGWPELYDEMCAVAARGAYRGMDYDSLSALGFGFSLGELPRLAALAHRVVAEERSARQGGGARGTAAAPDEGTADAPGPGQGALEAVAVREPVVGDAVVRVRAALMAASAG